MAQLHRSFRVSTLLPCLAAGVLAAPATARSQPYSRAQMTARVEAALARAIALMPPDLQRIAMAGRTTLPALNVRLAANPDENAYMAYSTDGRLYSYMDLHANSDDNALTHELGHYINHVLTGPRFKIIGTMAPDANHGVGVAHAPRQTITEDYAYYSQYALTGTVNGSDPSSGNWVASVRRGSHAIIQPKDVDYPSIEGFACALMAGLHKAPTVDFLGQRPRWGEAAVGLTAPDAWRLYASGASGIEQLRAAINGLFTTDRQRRAFQAMAEQIGWSYHGTATIQDTSGRKLPGVEVFPLIKDNQTIAHRLFSSTSGPDGKVEICRAYPGAYTLRVNTFYDRIDLPMETNWNRPTTDPVLFLTLRVPPIPTELKGTFTGPGTLRAPFTVRCREGVYVRRVAGRSDEPVANLASPHLSIQLDSLTGAIAMDGKFTPLKLLTRHDRKPRQASPKDKAQVVEQSGSLTERMDFVGADFGNGGMVHLTLQGTYTARDGATSPMKVPIGSLSVRDSVRADREKAK